MKTKISTVVMVARHVDSRKCDGMICDNAGEKEKVCIMVVQSVMMAKRDYDESGNGGDDDG